MLSERYIKIIQDIINHYKKEDQVLQAVKK